MGCYRFMESLDSLEKFVEAHKRVLGALNKYSLDRLLCDLGDYNKCEVLTVFISFIEFCDEVFGNCGLIYYTPHANLEDIVIWLNCGLFITFIRSTGEGGQITVGRIIGSTTQMKVLRSIARFMETSSPLRLGLREGL